MPEEISELHEHAEHGREGGLAAVTLTMAILAVFVAVVSLLGHRAHTEELLSQSKASDQWAYYQAKSIRQHTYQLFLDEIAVFSVRDAESADKVKEKYAHEVERYREELKEIETEAKKLESEVHTQQRRADRFDLGEVLLEAGLVITSITLLTRRRAFWGIGLVMGAAGMIVAAAGFFII